MSDDGNEVIDFFDSPVSNTETNEKSSFFSSFKNGVKNATKVAKDAVNNAATKITSAVNIAAKSTQEDIDTEQFGITKEDKDYIYKRFDELLLLEESPKSTITASTFVSDCVKNGQSAKFGDATFRTLDNQNQGEINRHQYLIGVWMTQKNDKSSKNKKWYEWRRKILFTYYNKSLEKSGLKFDDFCDFLEDLGKTLTPELFGVHTNWEEIIEEKVRVIGSQRRSREDKEREIVLRSKIELELKMKAEKEEHNVNSLTESLINATLEIAQLNTSNELLQKSYRDLEKQMCTLKLENARLQLNLEDLEDELLLSEKNKGWSGVLADTVAAMEAVGVPASIVLPAINSNSNCSSTLDQDFISLDMSVAGSTR